MIKTHDSPSPQFLHNLFITLPLLVPSSLSCATHNIHHYCNMTQHPPQPPQWQNLRRRHRCCFSSVITIDLFSYRNTKSRFEFKFDCIGKNELGFYREKEGFGIEITILFDWNRNWVELDCIGNKGFKSQFKYEIFNLCFGRNGSERGKGFIGRKRVRERWLFWIFLWKLMNVMLRWRSCFFWVLFFCV